MKHLLSGSLPLSVLLLLPFGAVSAQSQNGPFSAGSFEAPRYVPGALPGISMTSGQDGWMLFDSVQGIPNLAAAQIQSTVVRSGEQAVRWDASQMAPGATGELRRNALFNLSTGVIEVEFDFYLTSSSQPSTAWGFYTQPAPHPWSSQLLWDIQSDGEVHFMSTSNRVWSPTGYFVTRDTWHHTRTVVDIIGDATALYIDGQLVATGQPTATLTNLPAHGFTQLTLHGAGDDSLFFDNFTVRERTAPNSLSVDLEELRINRRETLTLRLYGEGAGDAYALLGSISGTTPGIPLGGVTLPLNSDWFLGALAGGLGTAALPGFLGTLSADGTANASFDTQVPVPAVLLGQTVNFAWFTYYPTVAASEPAAVRIIQ